MFFNSFLKHKVLLDSINSCNDEQVEIFAIQAGVWISVKM
jgi:hypothetical protein